MQSVFAVMILQFKLGILKSQEASEALLKNLSGFPKVLRPNWLFHTHFFPSPVTNCKVKL